MVSNDFSFAMVNHATGLAECWGDVKYGGDCSAVDFAGVLQVGMELRVHSDRLLSVDECGCQAEIECL